VRGEAETGRTRRIRKSKWRLTLLIPGAVLSLWLFLPVGKLFPDAYSTLVLDSEGGLLRATLAEDEQYRFPPAAEPLPRKYVSALLVSEDKRFFRHPGVDPLALANAALANIKAGRRVRGGSTITMQLARLSNPKSRTYFNKLRECLMALKLSLHFSKQEILELYSAHVPMGGNVRGLRAASYVYFGKPPRDLTWAEAALFAVLPRSPSMINLDRERPVLLRKRNDLLGRMLSGGVLDTASYRASCEEPLPTRVRKLPFVAPHFTRLVISREPGKKVIRTTLERDVQALVEDAARRHNELLSDQGIPNLAVLVLETRTGKVRAYLGSQDFNDSLWGGQVDGVRSRRSTGSLLKPFLAAKALDRGPYTLASRLQDVPTFYGTFAPENASKKFSGLVSMREMLVRSLNVPAVRLLNAHGTADFYEFLAGGGLKGLFRGPDGYGLSLILGGAEASLYELARLYLCLGNLGMLKPLVTEEERAPVRPVTRGDRIMSEGASWLVLNALRELSRPGVEFYWDSFQDAIPVAWKTGTSYGQRDGWSIGVNRQWTIGVWAGDFAGRGNAALSGAGSAAPLMFTLFNALTRPEKQMWFDEPSWDLEEVACCEKSGYPAGPYCPRTVMEKRPRCARVPGRCPFHRRYLVDRRTGRSVCSLCWTEADPAWVSRFIVPPAVAEILKNSGHSVDSVPIHSPDCPSVRRENPIDLVYPVDGIKIVIPRDYGGVWEKIVLSAKHQLAGAHLFWYLNGSLIGDTVGIHRLAVDLTPGPYRLTVQDEEGASRSVAFRVYKDVPDGSEPVAGLATSSSP